MDPYVVSYSGCSQAIKVYSKIMYPDIVNYTLKDLKSCKGMEQNEAALNKKMYTKKK